MQDYVKKILTARVYDVAIESPLDPMVRLSQRLHNSVLLKREDLQPVFSFKLRGAYNKMVGLRAEALKRGVICASAGNHAQGVALRRASLKVKATIVMPHTTPDIKVQAVKGRGGHIVLHGDTFDEAYVHARSSRAETGPTFIHPYDDPDVIAGQGTVGHGTPAPASGPDRGDLRADRGRRSGRRYRRVRQVPAAGRQGDRRRARGRSQHGGSHRDR